jgi:hypothetical protein
MVSRAKAAKKSRRIRGDGFLKRGFKMGLIKPKTCKYGFDAEYWKIISFRLEPLYNRADIVMGLFKDKEAADAGAEALETFTKRIFDRPQPKGSKIKEHTEYTDYLSADAMSNKHKNLNVYQIMYEAVKAVPPTNDTEMSFEDAKDEPSTELQK